MVKTDMERIGLFSELGYTTINARTQVAVDAEGSILVADVRKVSSSQPWVLRVVDLCSLVIPGA